MDFTMLRPNRVWDALEGHPDRPSLRTVNRWCETGSAPRWAEDAISERLGGTTKSPPAWAEGLEVQMNEMATKIDSFAEWHRRADEREEGHILEAATQGALEAVRLFLTENGIRLAADEEPDPSHAAGDHQPS